MSDPTPHADRDRSEEPCTDPRCSEQMHPPRTYAEGAFWPPAAPAAYVIEPVDADEPVPFVLTDEPVGDLLPAAPEGIVLQCAACPEALADTRGGRLVHHDDGSHTYVPPEEPATAVGDAIRRGREAIAEVDDLRAEIADRESERADLRDRVDKAEAAIARVRTLMAHLHTDLVYVGDLRAALEGP